MAEPHEPDEAKTPERIPLGQVFLDNIFLLLVLGIVVPVVLLTITPTQSGDVYAVCNEFWGIGHHQMVGKIIVE